MQACLLSLNIQQTCNEDPLVLQQHRIPIGHSYALSRRAAYPSPYGTYVLGEKHVSQTADAACPPPQHSNIVLTLPYLRLALTQDKWNCLWSQLVMRVTKLSTYYPLVRDIQPRTARYAG